MFYHDLYVIYNNYTPQWTFIQIPHTQCGTTQIFVIHTHTILVSNLNQIRVEMVVVSVKYTARQEYEPVLNRTNLHFRTVYRNVNQPSYCKIITNRTRNRLKSSNFIIFARVRLVIGGSPHVDKLRYTVHCIPQGLTKSQVFSPSL